MPKFKQGDKVVFHQGTTAEAVGLTPTVVAVVDKVSEGFRGMKYEKPLYHISWPPTGKACVRETDLTHAKRSL